MTGDRPLAGLAIRGAVLGGLVLLATVPVYVYVEPGWRPLVARLAAALVLGVVLLQLRRTLIDRLEAAGESALDDARVRRRPEPSVPHHFLDLISDVRTALRSRRYFDEVMWPRLTTFTTATLTRPPARRGRGPSRTALRALLDAIEMRR
jgi:hypothetical protein